MRGRQGGGVNLRGLLERIHDARAGSTRFLIRRGGFSGERVPRATGTTRYDALMELLEHHDMEVVYQFDRLHENTPDACSSAARSAGFELRFNERQSLETIWCHMKARDGFAATQALRECPATNRSRKHRGRRSW